MLTQLLANWRQLASSSAFAITHRMRYPGLYHQSRSMLSTSWQDWFVCDSRMRTWKPRIIKSPSYV